MNFLVLGVTGMAGHAIAIYLKERGHSVTGFARRKVDYCECISGDAFDQENIKNVIENNAYDAVVNCIGILNRDAEENKANAVYLNSFLPHYLADITKNMKTKVIHISTDCVFAGNKAPYHEKSFRDGETFYDRSKALGELEDEKNVTIRCSIVGPDINDTGIGLFNWFMKQEKAQGYTNAMWTGLTTIELAKVVEKATDESIHGLYNVVYKENISKYELLKLFNEYCRNNSVELTPNGEYSVDKTLISTRRDMFYEVPSYSSMIAEMEEWIKNHKELYPHYR